MFIVLMGFAILTIHLTGHALWALTLVNLAWMLFKDHTLFSWWWVVADLAVFVSLIVAGLVVYIWSRD